MPGQGVGFNACLLLPERDQGRGVAIHLFGRDSSVSGEDEDEEASVPKTFEELLNGSDICRSDARDSLGDPFAEKAGASESYAVVLSQVQDLQTSGEQRMIIDLDQSREKRLRGLRDFHVNAPSEATAIAYACETESFLLFSFQPPRIAGKGTRGDG